MSEQRIPDMAFSRTIARENGKIKKGKCKSDRFSRNKHISPIMGN